MLVDNGTPFNETQVGTNAGATATHAAITNRTFFVRNISGYTDTNSKIQVLGGSDGTTIVWESLVNVAVDGSAFSFNILAIGTPGISMAGKVVTSTTDCRVNISGFSIP